MNGVGQAKESGSERYLVIPSFTLHRQAVGIAFVLSISGGVAWLAGSHGLWWLAAFCAMLGGVGIIAILRTPQWIEFDYETREIRLNYAIDVLAPSRRRYRLDDWDYIGSVLDTSGETYVVALYVGAQNGPRLVLKSLSPVEDAAKSIWSWDRYLEPEEIRILRERIASQFGLADRGYRVQ